MLGKGFSDVATRAVDLRNKDVPTPASEMLLVYLCVSLAALVPPAGSCSAVLRRQDSRDAIPPHGPRQCLTEWVG
jgi:hypothetical protein